MHGLLEWVDVSVPDVERGMEFYAELFGWDISPISDDEADYFMCRKDGKLAAGLLASSTKAGTRM